MTCLFIAQKMENVENFRQGNEGRSGGRRRNSQDVGCRVEQRRGEVQKHAFLNNKAINGFALIVLTTMTSVFTVLYVEK